MEILVSIFSAIGKTIAAIVLAIVSLVPAWNTQTTPVPVLVVPEPSPAATTTVTVATSTNGKPTPQKDGLAQGVPAGARGAGVGAGHTEDPRGPLSGVSVGVSTPTPTAPSKPQEQINTETRAALVNILCLPKVGLPRGVSGSGILIDSRGIILTNAHIAQFFLLKDYRIKDNVECTIRTGSPAENRYTAELVYLPPQWISANAKQIVASTAMGTGQYDYAILRLTGSTNPQASLPATLPNLTTSLANPAAGEPMLLASYPAGFLSTELIQKNLYQSSAVTHVTQLFSFEDNTNKVELFSIGGTVLSQGGSSGGAVVDGRSGNLVGMITTATSGEATSERDLRAMTMKYINEDLANAGFGGLAGLLSGDLPAKAADFQQKIAPGERAQLEAVLNAQ